MAHDSTGARPGKTESGAQRAPGRIVTRLILAPASISKSRRFRRSDGRIERFRRRPKGEGSRCRDPVDTGGEDRKFGGYEHLGDWKFLYKRSMDTSEQPCRKGFSPERKKSVPAETGRPGLSGRDRPADEPATDGGIRESYVHRGGHPASERGKSRKSGMSSDAVCVAGPRQPNRCRIC